MSLTRRLAPTATLATLTLALAACGGGSDPLASDPAPGEGGGTGGGASASTIVVGSADFSESRLLAQVYHGALESAGVPVGEPRLGIGAREAYLKGLEDGSINLIPEYTGALALFYDKDFATTEPQEVYEELQGLLPEHLTVLEASEAENKDSITVTEQTAQEHSLQKVSDLAPVAGELTLGAPPEFQSRAQGVPGLESTYGITFGQVRNLGGQALVQALANGQVDAANIFTTDPSITEQSFVVLEDDENLFGAQNVVPLITKEAAQNQQVTDTLNGVSEQLTTEELQAMLKKVDVDKQDPAAVADEWLSENDLG